MITKKQKELYEYLQNYIGLHDIAPSYEEMQDAIGLRSKSGVHRLIKGLEERGYVERLPNRARAIAIKESKKEPRVNHLIWAFLDQKGLATQFARYMEVHQ